MSGLKIPVSALERGAYEVDASVPEEELRPEGAKQLALGVTRVRGRMTTVPPRYVFLGELTGTYFRECDRCLADTEVVFRYDVVWTFQHGVAPISADPASEQELDETDSGETETMFFEGAEIDLGLPAWEELVLLAPSKTLCQDTCAGLCPQCGANRNESPCDCKTEEDPDEFGNDGLSGLANLFPDLDPKDSKE